MTFETMQEEDVQKVVTCHKEESLNRIKSDVADRKGIHETPSTCIDVFISDKHPPSSLVIQQ